MDGHVAHHQAHHRADRHIDDDGHRACASSPRPTRPTTTPTTLATTDNPYHHLAHLLAHHRTNYDSHHNHANHHAQHRPDHHEPRRCSPTETTNSALDEQLLEAAKGAKLDVRDAEERRGNR